MDIIRNADWKEDESLKNDLQKYVLKNLKRIEILDFVKRDFPQYAWSLGTLSRRLEYFDIKYIDYNITLEEVEAAFKKENEGPGQLLGYRQIHQKIREEHNLAVPRGLVYDVMTKVDPEGLQLRGDVGVPRNKRKRRGPTGTFTSLVSSYNFQCLGTSTFNNLQIR
jgi:hypothetical protein